MPSPLQLLVELDVELPDGRLQRAKALIDTGAEVDLVRSGFVPRHLFSPAVVPMVFIMANGSNTWWWLSDCGVVFSIFAGECELLRVRTFCHPSHIL